MPSSSSDAKGREGLESIKLEASLAGRIEFIVAGGSPQLTDQLAVSVAGC
jgi:hypothetical protein